MHPSRSDSVSMIVPVLNDAPSLRSFARRLRRDQPDELIVVDGGSTDGSLSAARRLEGWTGYRWVEAGGGLARQLNRGAALASGDVLFFPYVDSRLPDAWAGRIAEVLADPGVVAGAFRFDIDGGGWAYRVVAACANLRTSLGLGPFGDQAIFVRRAAFEAAGGFREDVLLEDLDFVRRLRRLGRVEISSVTVKTSARRWEHRGLLRATVENWRYLGLHFLPGAARRRDDYRRYRVESH